MDNIISGENAPQVCTDDKRGQTRCTSICTVFITFKYFWNKKKNHLAKNYPTIHEIYILSIFRKYYSDNFAYHIWIYVLQTDCFKFLPTLHNILLKMKSPKYTSFSTKLYLYINARLRLRIKNKCFRVV